MVLDLRRPIRATLNRMVVMMVVNTKRMGEQAPLRRRRRRHQRLALRVLVGSYVRRANEKAVRNLGLR